MGKGAIDTTGLYNYYGRIAGVVCLGEADELLAIILDAHEVWPAAAAWTDGEVLAAGDLRRYNARTWQSRIAHTASSSNAPGDENYWEEYTFRLDTIAAEATPLWDPQRAMYHQGEWVWDEGAIFQAIAEVNQSYYIAHGWVRAAYRPGGSVLSRFWEFVKWEAAKPSGEGTVQVSNRGTITLLNARTPADVSAVMNAGLTGYDVHPTYKGLCVVYLSNFHFGTQRTTAPNMELVIRRRPNQNIVEGDLAALQSGQANVIAAAAEILTSDLCLGLSADKLDRNSFADAAALIRAIPGYAALSLKIDAQTTARALFSDLAEQADAWLRWNAESGWIQAGAFTHGTAPATYHALTIADLTARPEFDAEGWDGMKTGLSVSYTDRQRAFKGTSVTVSDIRARQVLGEPRIQNISRDSICRTGQARAHGREALRVIGRPQLTATLQVRRERARDIRVGDWVRYDIDLEPSGDTLQQYFRVREKTLPAWGAVTLQLDADETLTPVGYEHPDPTLVPTDSVPANVTAALMVPSPPDLSEHQCDFIPLIQRPNAEIVRCGVHFTCNLDYQSVGQVDEFAVKVALTADVESDDLEITISADVQTDIGLLADSPGETRAAGDYLLLFLCRAAAANGPVTQNSGGWPKVEVCSVADIALTAAGEYTLTVKRGRLGTYRRQHQQTYSGGDITAAWIVRSQSLKPVWHPALRDVWYDNSEPSQFYFRLQPGNSRTWRALTDCSDWSETNLFRQHLGYPAIWDFSDGTDTNNYVALLGVASVATSSRARATNVATLVTATDHGLLTGALVTITGLGGTGYNLGPVAITKVNATSFTYASPGGDEGTTADTGGDVSQWPQDVTVEGKWKDFGQTLVSFKAVLIAPDGTETAITEDSSMAQSFDPTDATATWAFTASVNPVGYAPDANGRIQFTLLLSAANAAGRVRRFPYYIMCGPT